MAFNQSVLQNELTQLQSPESHELWQDSFVDLLDGKVVQSTEFVELEYSAFPWKGKVRMINAPPRSRESKVPQAPAELVHQVQLKVAEGRIKTKESSYASEVQQVSERAEVPKEKKSEEGKPEKTKMKRPPAPMTKVPVNPCKDPNAGAPSQSVKRAAKCTMSKAPQCYKLQGRFLLIQSGIQDQSDLLQEQISNLEESCKETEGTLQSHLDGIDAQLKASQTKLADATQKEAAAGESARQISKEVDEFHNELKKEMQACNANYISLETEMCGLKKIRGELYKKAGLKPFFQDCQLSKWTPGPCSKKCEGGKLKLTRQVQSQPQGGAKCLPLVAMRSCNEGPCPVDCVLNEWSGWSKCSTECGGGIAQRLRDVKVAMKNGGKPCSKTSMTKVCNVHACEKDCELSRWTLWTSCSKDCDGGSMKRNRFVKSPALGGGKCAGTWSKDRLQYKDCNVKSCTFPKGQKTLTCNNKLDVVVMLDGSPDSGKSGWSAQITAVKTLLDAFAEPVKVSLIQYSGPRTWSGVSKCTGKSGKKVDIEKDCRIKVVSQFTGDKGKLKQLVGGLTYAKGGKLMSLALITAKSELSQGRAEARSVVVAFIDGRPLSFRQTSLAARKIRKSARLLWVPLIKMGPLKEIKTWATRRWQENVVQVKTTKELADPNTVTHVIANICPKRAPKLKVKKDSKSKK
jgi:hypothetical protein